MTDKELRKLRRSDLIEILYYLSRENDELREENGKLREKLDAFVLQAAAVQTAGSIETAEKNAAQPPRRNNARKTKRKGKKKRR